MIPTIFLREPTSSSNSPPSPTRIGIISTPEQIIVEFNAIADNSIAGSNDAGDVVKNQARATNNSNNATLANNAPCQQHHRGTQSVGGENGLIGPPTVPEAGGPISFEIVVSAASRRPIGPPPSISWWRTLFRQKSKLSP